jgi:hypothetical protein
MRAVAFALPMALLVHPCSGWAVELSALPTVGTRVCTQLTH